ncbi:hypothetical protein [Rufibacter latericius]|uniref:Uncharacterized protein n=1 Tax=Rufibacter latericius TaxID=2487040 RepID=A0A3M9MM83_9BACT|nr:hypothetical protein [Rufibacter latericius]RNI26591.1 hypothetical protein EFB08_11270 [Rufibacter latericius]
MEKLLSSSQHVDSGPALRVYRGNPLAHKDSFTPGDSIRATNPGLGMDQGIDYPILGYWNSEQFGMYVYIPATANAMMKHYRFAVTEERSGEEVLFYLLPEEITEICIKDCLFGLEYVPATAPEVIMKATTGGMQKEETRTIPFHSTGIQLSLFSVA